MDVPEASLANDPSNLPYHKRPSACFPCAARKVKCDRTSPCTACQKSHIECTYERPFRPARKRKKASNQYEHELEQRVKSYEETLKNAGLPLSSPDQFTASNSTSRLTPSNSSAVVQEGGSLPIGAGGVLVPEQDGQRYYEHALLAQINKTCDHSTGNDLEHDKSPPDTAARHHIFGQDAQCLAGEDCPLPCSLTPHYNYPKATDIKKLISVFFADVNPLTQLIPASTSRLPLCDVAEESEKCSVIQKALLHAVCACSIVSQIRSQNPRQRNQDEKLVDLAYHHHTAWHSLRASSFLKSSNLMVVQAYLLLLTSMQYDHDPMILWTLLGLCVRIAQRMGLHRDGNNLGLSPFDTEIRRRIWWYLVVFDLRITELSGTAKVIPSASWDTRIPLNINDQDLNPSMQVAPEARNKFTDMTFCLLRYRIAHVLRTESDFRKLRKSNQPGSNPVGAPESTAASETDIKTALEVPTELQDLIESVFLRDCDPLVPVENFTAAISRSMLAKFRLISLFDQTSHDANTQRLVNSLKVIQYDNLIHSTRSVRGFLWYAKHNFAGGSLLQLLRQLEILASENGPNYPNTADQDRETMPEEAWQQLEELFYNHPEFKNVTKPFAFMVAKRTIEVWEMEAKRRSRISTYDGSIDPPEFVDELKLALATRYESLQRRSILQTSLGSEVDPQGTSSAWPNDISSMPLKTDLGTNGGVESYQFGFVETDWDLDLGLNMNWSWEDPSQQPGILNL